jgi:hypothetical protein
VITALLWNSTQTNQSQQDVCEKTIPKKYGTKGLASEKLEFQLHIYT